MLLNAAQVTIADPNLPCPCDSGRAGIACCLDDRGRIINVPPEVSIRAPAGEYLHPRCYAAPLGGCSEELSREHYLSDSIQQLMAEGGGHFRLSKFHFLGEGETLDVGPGALNAKVLCREHNSALSGYDGIGLRFCRAVLQCGTPGDAPHAVLFNGEDLEHWLLKVLCGVAAMERGGSQGWYAPIPWLNALFKTGAERPAQLGLWMKAGGGVVMFESNAPNTALTPLDDPGGGAPLGLQFDFCGLRFILLTSQRGLSRVLPGGVLRPGLVEIPAMGGYPRVRLGIRYRGAPAGVVLTLKEATG